MTTTAPTHPVLSVQALGNRWVTTDPFLFCAYHDDHYPAADDAMAPDAPLQGREIGSDFSGKDGWSMYHGDTVPGFPGHPHRGFETVSIVRRGVVDHSDSMGATARYGEGDVQWLTAGRGIQHAEMFPLLHSDRDNPLELFQIWLNLPARKKMSEPNFSMFWADQIPRYSAQDAGGRRTDVSVIAGTLQPVENGVASVQPLAPPPDSWAADADSDVAIWTLRMDANAHWTLPAARGSDTRRVLYFFKGQHAQVAGQRIDGPATIVLRADAAVELVNGEGEAEFVVLQGRPIGESVAQYGPFVMNTQAEIMQAMNDYRRTQFGGWPWPSHGPVHARDAGRFARYPDGRIERAGSAPTTASTANASANANAD